MDGNYFEKTSHSYFLSSEKNIHLFLPALGGVFPWAAEPNL